MKEEINLMPPIALRARLRRLYVERLRSLYTALVVALLLVGAGYGGAFGVFYFTNQNLAAVLQTNSGVSADTDSHIRQINASLAFIRDRLEQRPAWTPQVVSALTAAPNGVMVTSFEVNSSAQTLAIVGKADSQSAIVDYEKKLRRLPWADSVEAPLQNFATGPDVVFHFTIKRKI